MEIQFTGLHQLNLSLFQSWLIKRGWERKVLEQYDETTAVFYVKGDYWVLFPLSTTPPDFAARLSECIEAVFALEEVTLPITIRINEFYSASATNIVGYVNVETLHDIFNQDIKPVSDIQVYTLKTEDSDRSSIVEIPATIKISFYKDQFLYRLLSF